MSRIQREATTKISRIGHIRIGERAVNQAGKEYPRSLDYFKADGTYAQLFRDEFGEKPSSIEIIFMSDDDDISCSERYELRKGKDLFGYSNDNKYYLWNGAQYMEFDPKDGAEFRTKAEAKLKEQDKSCKWETVLYMNFIIIRLRSVFGYWTLTTKGAASSIPNIVSTFDMVREMTGGRVRGIPFDLRVEKVKSQKPGDKSVFPVITLIPNMSLQNMEKIRSYLEAGKDLRGLLTENNIKLIGGNDENN